MSYPILPYDILFCLFCLISNLIGLGIIQQVGGAAAAAGVSLFSVLQNPITNKDNIDFVITTEEVSLSQVNSLINSVDNSPNNLINH